MTQTMTQTMTMTESTRAVSGRIGHGGILGW